jgi:hypothetical protein
LPPFATWYAANLFAIVQRVLIALVTAMSLYICAWVRQGE